MGLRPIGLITARLSASIFLFIYWTIEGWPFGPARHGPLGHALGIDWPSASLCRSLFYLGFGPVTQRATSPTLSTAWAKLRLAHALYGTTSWISLRNCCVAAIRYEIQEVVPAFWGLRTRPLEGNVSSCIFCPLRWALKVGFGAIFRA